LWLSLLDRGLSARRGHDRTVISAPIARRLIQPSVVLTRSDDPKREIVDDERKKGAEECDAEERPKPLAACRERITTGHAARLCPVVGFRSQQGCHSNPPLCARRWSAAFALEA